LLPPPFPPNAVYLVLTEVVRRASLVEHISGLKTGSVSDAANIPVAVTIENNDAEASKVSSCLLQLMLVS